MLAEASSEMDWLKSLPDRVGTEDFERVKAIAYRMVPQLPACTDDEFVKYMRIMSSTLKAKDDDNVTGKIRLRAYQSRLGHHPAEAIRFMAQFCADRMIFFPAISECHEVLDEWQNPMAKPCNLANHLCAKQREHRFNDLRDTLRAGTATQDQIDQAPEQWRAILFEQGYLRFDATANKYIIRERKHDVVAQH